MRTSQKRDVLEMIATLHEAHDVIRNDIELKKYASAQDMLSQCQECAVRVGTAIEESEGEGFVTISHIEEYCEVLYRIYQELDANGDVAANKMRKTLEKYMLKIENSVKHDLNVRKEMVFLPYKSSMWDSLESVWRAADEDPECDAYVVPIPYYDKNPDGTFSKEYYEGDKFPADVPITHYNDYDFETRHPDAIFIHNPYDHGNLVTSVHPYFYSDKLKQYCDKLIYIPYYISAESNPYSLAVMEKKSGFILTFGVMNANMVIVQSENTKKLYINVLRKYLPDISREYWENKIFGLGSPKLDRVNSIQRDDNRLPEKWKRIIYNENGIRKKTILYNISLSTLLKNPEMIDKIKDVLDFFKENTDAALWWRPHPLYESTLASMRPEMLGEYKKLVNAYKEEGWGIFDEGVDLEWAIAETDAYYGDPSSVVQLYKEAEKPIMLQNVWARTKREVKAGDIPIWPAAFCVDGDDFWFVHGKMNVLMRYSMSENYTYVVGVIPNEVVFREGAYIGVYKWNNKVFMIPSFAREIAVFDVVQNRFEKVALNNTDQHVAKGLFSKIYAKGKYLYCIPNSYQAILKINMDNNHIDYIAFEGFEQSCLGNSARIGDEIIALYAYTNQALFLNMESDSVSVKELGNISRQFTKIACIDEKIYLFDKISRWIVEVCKDEPLGETRFYEPSYESFKLTSAPGGLLILDSVKVNEMLMMNAQKEIVFQAQESIDISHGSLYSIYHSGIESGDRMTSDVSFYFSRNTYSMYRHNGETFENLFSMKLTDSEYNRLKNMLDIEDMEINENDVYELKTWIEDLKKRSENIQEAKQDCGMIIWQEVKRQLNK